VEELLTSRLVTNSSGNVSVRIKRPKGYLVAITPSRMGHKSLTIENVQVIDSEGEPVEGDLMPSSESALHLLVYQERPDVGAIIHTHSVFASVFAVAGKEIPPIIDEMVIAVGGSVPVAEYAFPGTEELAQRACYALKQRNAALLRNHGAVAVGRTMREALDTCHLLERVSQIYVYSLLLGKPDTIPVDAVQAELEIFRMRREIE
jgi:ribulose-5-phosphate 4-epimerase/fuculose-1-phosphate aldolase